MNIRRKNMNISPISFNYFNVLRTSNPQSNSNFKGRNKDEFIRGGSFERIKNFSLKAGANPEKIESAEKKLVKYLASRSHKVGIRTQQEPEINNQGEKILVRLDDLANQQLNEIEPKNTYRTRRWHFEIPTESNTEDRNAFYALVEGIERFFQGYKFDTNDEDDLTKTGTVISDTKSFH